MTRALVTGSSGFVGRHMARALVERGYDVVGIDINDAQSPAVSEFWGGDLRHFLDSDLRFGRYFDLVVHCAAVVGGRTMIDGKPLHLMVEDLSLDAALFRWALQARPGRLVYFSSSAAYPVSHQMACMPRWLTEDTINGEHIERPDATYGWVKLTGERLAAEANRAGIPTHVFRPFSGYGTDQALDYPFPTFIRRALHHEDPFVVWGDPTSCRDWVHINDVVGCVLAAVDAEALGPLNICTGRATSFDEFAKLCMLSAGYQAPIARVEDAPQGVHTRVGDPAEMLKIYTPKVTLEEGICRAMEGGR